MMGSYGIGPARIVAAAIEQGADEKGIVWPPRARAVARAPGRARQGRRRDRRGGRAALRGARARPGSRPLYDDRDAGPGEKLTDAELLGCPLRIVVGKRALAEGEVEAQERAQRRRAPARRSPTRRGAAARDPRRARPEAARTALEAPAVRHRPLRARCRAQTRARRAAAPVDDPEPGRLPAARRDPGLLVLAFDSDDGRDTAAALLYLGDRRSATTSTASSPAPPASTGAWARCSTRSSTGSRCSPAPPSAGTSSCCRAGRWRCSRCARSSTLVLARAGAAARGRPRDQLDRADRRLPRLRRDLLGHGPRLVDHPGGVRRRRRARGPGDGRLRARRARPSRRRDASVQPSSST